MCREAEFIRAAEVQTFEMFFFSFFNSVAMQLSVTLCCIDRFDKNRGLFALAAPYNGGGLRLRVHDWRLNSEFG